MKISNLKIEEPFKSLHLIKKKILEAIQKDMSENGFDQSHPIILWKGQNIVVDGHTRIQAAINLGIKDVPIVERDFKGIDEALKFAIYDQNARRNLKDGDILHLVNQVDRTYQKADDMKSNFENQNIYNLEQDITTSDSREITPEIVGIHRYKVSQCRHILNHCSRKEIDEIYHGYKSIYQVYKASLDAHEKMGKRIVEEQEKNKILKESKIMDFKSIVNNKEFGKVVQKMKDFSFKITPKLKRRSQEVSKLRETVEYFKSLNEKAFNTFCERKPVQKFLGSLFVNDFISTLKGLGYNIEKPTNLNIIEEEKPKKKIRPSPQPHCSIEKCCK